jgi:hypothetical protein
MIGGNGRKRRVNSLLLVLALVLPVTSSLGDVIHLKNGKKAEGEVVSQVDGMVVLKTKGQELQLPASLIDRIETTQSGVAADPSRAAGLVQSGHYREAFKLCEKLMKDPSAESGLKREVADQRRQAIQGAQKSTRARYANLIESGKIEECIRMVEEQRSQAAPETFDELVLRRCESDLRLTLAAQCLDRKDHAAAVVQVDRVEELGVSDSAMRAKMGTILLETPESGASMRAAGFLRDAVNDDPNDHSARIDLIRALTQADLTSQAVGVWEQGPQGFAESTAWTKENRDVAGRALRTEAFAALNTGQRDRAKDLFGQGVAFSLPGVPLYEDAVRFYTMVGDGEAADKMTNLLDAETKRREALLSQGRTAAAQPSSPQAVRSPMSSSGSRSQTGHKIEKSSGERTSHFNIAPAAHH